MSVTKAKLNALEKVFAAEIENRLPFQSRAKVYSALCDEGLLSPFKRVFGSGIFAISVTGYELTHLGRMLYCANCATPEETK